MHENELTRHDSQVLSRLYSLSLCLVLSYLLHNQLLNVTKDKNFCRHVSVSFFLNCEFYP